MQAQILRALVAVFDAQHKVSQQKPQLGSGCACAVPPAAAALR
jgi:hypothetical protein